MLAAILRILLAGALALAAEAAAAPHQAPLSARDLVGVTDLSTPAVSPDGRLVLVRSTTPDVDRNTVAIAWRVIDRVTAAEVLKIDGGEPLYEKVYWLQKPPAVWAADSGSFYFRALRNGEVQVWRAFVPSGLVRPVTQATADVIGFAIDDAAGEILFMTGPSKAEVRAEERRQYLNGVLMSPAVNPVQNLFGSMRWNGEMFARRRSVTPSREWTTVLDVRAPMLHIAKLADGREVAPQQGDRARLDRLIASYAAPTTGLTVGPNGERLEAPSVAGSARRLRFSSGSAGPWTDCTDPACEGAIAGATFAKGGKAVIFVVIDGLRSSLRRLDLASGKVVTLASDGTLDGSERTLSSGCPVAGREAICIAASALEPPRLVAFDIETGRRRVLFSPNGSLAAKVKTGVVSEVLSWKDHEGRQSHGVLLLPVGSKEPLPLVVVTYYCGGFLRGGTGDEYPEHLLVRGGIAVLCADFDSSWWNEPPPEGMPAVYSPINAGRRSIETGIAVLTERGIVDPKRVGAGGLSMGSMAVQHTLYKTDALAAAAVSGPAGTDPIYYWQGNGPQSSYQWQVREGWGLPEPDLDNLSIWKAVSPALNADKIRAPLLIQADEGEYQSMMQLYSRLTNLDRPVEAYVFADEGHQKLQPAHRLAVYTRNVDWFRFWLQGYEDPDLEKVEQYRRWRAMEQKQVHKRR